MKQRLLSLLVVMLMALTANAQTEHEYVDLGLPSGTLWATCNVGANSPEEFGDYFAWGETEPKDEYSWSTYKWCRGSSNTMTKYCQESNDGYNGFTDTLAELLPEDDAATANWGSGWQIPSWKQLHELINSDYTTTLFATQNGVGGRLITSKSNGNSIFLPATSSCGGEYGNEGVDGYYWTRTTHGTRSYSLYFGFYSEEGLIWNYYRYNGQSVRPVWKQNSQNVLVGDVNGDGQVTIADGVAVLNAMAGESVSGNADVNGDGDITIADFVAVLNIMAEQ